MSQLWASLTGSNSNKVSKDSKDTRRWSHGSAAVGMDMQGWALADPLFLTADSKVVGKVASQEVRWELLPERFKNVDVMHTVAVPVERLAARRLLGPAVGEDHVLRTEVLGYTCYLGTIAGRSAVLVRGHEMGRAAAKAMMHALVAAWMPNIIVSSGVAAGVDPSLQLGDVIVVTEAVDMSDEEMKRRRAGSELVAAFQAVRPQLDAWAASVVRPSDKSVADPAIRGKAIKIVSGTIAVENSVIKDHKLHARIAEKAPDALGIEMEAIGLADGLTTVGMSEWLMIKTVVDRGDESKSKEAQLFGAMAATNLVHRVVASMPQLPDTTPITLQANTLPNQRAFYGRTRDLDKLSSQLEKGSKACVLVSEPAMGKSAVALAYAWQGVQQQRFDIVLWIDASSLATSFSQAARALGLTLSELPDQDAVRTAVIAHLSKSPRHWLVVFDSAASSSAVKAYLPPVSPAHKVLITSRDLKWPGALSIGPLDKQDAADLLLAASGRSEALTDTNAAVLLAMLQHQPLAVQLAARIMHEDHVTPTQVIDELKAAGIKAKSKPQDVVVALLRATMHRDTVPSLAREILRFSCLFAPSRIPEDEMLRQIPRRLGLDESVFSKAMRCLWKRGLFSYDGTGTVAVHRVVQEFIHSASEVTDVIQGRVGYVNALKAIQIAMRAHSATSASDARFFRLIAPHLHTFTSYMLPQGLDHDTLQVVRVRYADACSSLASYHTSVGELDLARVMLLRGLETAVKGSTARAILLISSSWLEGLAGQPDTALDLLRQAEQEYHEMKPSSKELIVTRDLGLINVQVKIGAVMNMALQFDKAVVPLRKARESLESMSPPPAESENGKVYMDMCVSVYTSLGVAYEGLGQFSDAADVQEKALALAEKTDPSGGTASMSKLNLGIVYDRLGQFQRAEKLFREVVEYRRRVFGVRNVRTAEAMANLAANLSISGNATEAIPVCEETIDILAEAYGRDSAKVVPVIMSLGVSLDTAGQHERAITVLSEALERAVRVFGGDSAFQASVLVNLGAANSNLGRVDAALSHYKQALEIKRKLFGPGSINTVQVMTNIGDTLIKLNRLDEAVDIVVEAIGVVDASIGPLTRARVALMELFTTIQFRFHLLLRAYQAAGEELKVIAAVFAMPCSRYADRLMFRGHMLRLYGDAAGAAKEFEAARAMYQQVFASDDHPLVQSAVNSRDDRHILCDVCSALGRATPLLTTSESRMCLDCAGGVDLCMDCINTGRTTDSHDPKTHRLIIRNSLDDPIVQRYRQIWAVYLEHNPQAGQDSSGTEASQDHQGAVEPSVGTVEPAKESLPSSSSLTQPSASVKSTSKDEVMQSLKSAGKTTKPADVAEPSAAAMGRLASASAVLAVSGKARRQHRRDGGKGSKGSRRRHGKGSKGSRRKDGSGSKGSRRKRGGSKRKAKTDDDAKAEPKVTQ